MRPIPRIVPLAAVLAFAVWCALTLRGDLARLSLAPVARSWDLIGLAGSLSLLNYGLRIVRWRGYLAYLGHPLPYRFTVLVYLAGFAYTLLPGKVGELVRARYYTPVGVPLSDVAAAFFAERLTDLMTMVVLAACLVTAFTPYAGAIAGTTVLIAGVLTALARAPWARISAALETRPRVPRRARAVLGGLTAALASTRPLLRPGMLLAALAMGIVAWGLEGVGLRVLSSMYPSAHLDVVRALGIYGVAVLVGGVTFLPGGLGGTEAVMTALLTTCGLSAAQAIVVTVGCRVLTLWLAVGLGWLSVFALRTRLPARVCSWP